jgi:predicted nucleic acid-binding protein
MTVLHGVSRHVLPQAADWPDRYHVTGYWFLGDGGGWRPPDELAAFLEGGPAPVAIGFGSMTSSNPAAMARLVVDAARAAGRRAILLTGWERLDGRALGADVLAVPAAPHDWLYPRVAAAVHHGGAGTVVAALAAGTPNVIVPHMADQPYWGRRVAALGVGPRPIPRHRLTVARLEGAIRLAAEDAALRGRAAALGARIRAEDGIFIARESGRPLDVEALPDRLAVSVVTIGELRAGVLAAPDLATRDRRLATLTAALLLEPIPVDEDVAGAWARLRVTLRDLGLRMAVSDSWIAATALALGVPVVTQDDDYPEVPGLPVVHV